MHSMVHTIEGRYGNGVAVPYMQTSWRKATHLDLCSWTPWDCPSHLPSFFLSLCGWKSCCTFRGNDYFCEGENPGPTWTNALKVIAYVWTCKIYGHWRPKKEGIPSREGWGSGVSKSREPKRLPRLMKMLECICAVCAVSLTLLHLCYLCFPYLKLVTVLDYS